MIASTLLRRLFLDRTSSVLITTARTSGDFVHDYARARTCSPGKPIKGASRSRKSISLTVRSSSS